MRTLTQTVGLCGVVLLALTACESTNEEPPEDDSQEDAAEDIGGEDDRQPAELEEIQDRIWDSSTTQESVSISGEVSASLVGWDTLEDGEDPDSDAAGAQNIDISVAGDAAGEGSAYQRGEVFEYLIFGDDIYQSVDSVVAEYELSQPPEGTDPPPSQEVRRAFEAEGSWANVGPAARDYVETPADVVVTLREGVLDAAEVDSLAELGLEGDSDTRDGNRVWVYRMDQGEEFIEVVVNADENEPLLRQLSFSSGSNRVDLDFNEWNAAEAPQEPEAEEVIEPDEVQVILDSLSP